MNPLLKETFVFRPLDSKPGMLRYAGGVWIPDDGQPDLAFIVYGDAAFVLYVDMPHYSNLLWGWSELRDGKRISHFQTVGNQEWVDQRWVTRSAHPNEVATRSGMRKCCDLYGCANGRGIDLIHDNAYISQGLLLIQSSGKPVTAPENPVCYLCLNDGKGHRIKDLIAKQNELESDVEVYAEDINRYSRKAEEAEASLEYAEEKLRQLRTELAREEQGEV